MRIGRARVSRTLVAAVLVGTALAVPCWAWYQMGIRSVEREAEDLLHSATAESSRTAMRLSERVGQRLAAVLRAESARPFYQYSFRYPDLTEDCECAAWVESPIARGPADSWIAAQFQIDPALRLTLPTIPDEFDEIDGRPLGVAHLDAAQLMQRRLAEAILPLVRAARRAGGEAGGGGEDHAAIVPASTDPATVITAWGGNAAEVSPFRWHTAEIDGCPELVGLRSVRSSDGLRVQGLLISRETVEKSFAAETFPAAFLPAEESNALEIVEPVDLRGVQWVVQVDPGPTLYDARERGRDLVGHFRRFFWGGTGGAAIAALLVVGLVGQSDRLARERSTFAAAAAHELRTPLAGLRVYGDLLADDLGDPAAGRDYARQISSEAERLGRVVSNVLGYTNLERGTAEVNPEPADAGALIREMTDRLRPALETAGATLALRIAETLPPVALDPDAVEQILRNLLDNAERYSRDAADRTIQVSVIPGGRGIHLTVADRGPGVDPANRRRLFRPFARGEDPDAPSGLGLGLALVAALASGHGGQATHEPREGGGSVFTVEFPRS
ncbi:MAG: HAMP domain-containing histidine kinase [Gemmatimonadetes bacterium]|nr:HAMP domain-containing histidine kinase [Gemmatimonadota bacterium]